MTGEHGPVVVSLDDPTAFERAAALLRSGEAIALPTDTVYGLASLALDAQAQQRLFEIKHRPSQVSIAVLAADLTAAESLVRFTPLAQRLAERFWPGALTLVAEMRPETPAHLGNGETLGVRVPSEPLVRSLATPPGATSPASSRSSSSVGPLAVTSANIHGQDTPTSAAEIAEMFPELPLVIDGGVRAGPASTVADVTGGEPVVLREGDITAEALMTATQDA